MPSLLAPRFWPAHLLGLAAVGAAIWLGLWQLSGWQATRHSEARDLTGLAPIPLTEAMGPDEPFMSDDVGRPVTVEGTWLPDSTLYVEGKRHEGADGWWVVTPVEVGDPGDPALLVVRGWTGDISPRPPAPRGVASLTTWLQPPDGTLVDDDDPSDDILPQVRIADAIQHVDQDLYGGYGVLDHAADNTNPGDAGLAPADLEQLPTSKASSGLRNLLYGVEWFIFGAFAGFVWWRYLRDEMEREHARRLAELTGGPDDVDPDEAAADGLPAAR